MSLLHDSLLCSSETVELTLHGWLQQQRYQGWQACWGWAPQRRGKLEWNGYSVSLHDPPKQGAVTATSGFNKLSNMFTKQYLQIYHLQKVLIKHQLNRMWSFTNSTSHSIQTLGKTTERQYTAICCCISETSSILYILILKRMLAWKKLKRLRNVLKTAH